MSKLASLPTIILTIFLLALSGLAQSGLASRQTARTMTVPITFFSREKSADRPRAEYLEAGYLIVKEDGEPQTILSLRSVTSTPLHLAILIQEDLSSEINLQLRDIAKFIKQLPADSRVMVAYLRAGSIQVVQKFTADRDRAANSLRVVSGAAGMGPRSPYQGLEEALERFDSLPTGRRAVLLISDGLDTSEGVSNIVPGSSAELDRAILKAQRKAVSVYSFYSSGPMTMGGNSRLIAAGQGSLGRLSDETGGRAFFAGSFSPVSFEPFFRELDVMLTRQFALTYLSTHMKKDFHKLEVASTNPGVGIEHPSGYFYR